MGETKKKQIYSQRSACRDFELLVDRLSVGNTSWPNVFSSLRCVFRWRRIAYCDSVIDGGLLVQYGMYNMSISLIGRWSLLQG